MSTKKELAAAKKAELKEAKMYAENLKMARRKETKNFFEQAKRRLLIEFNKNPNAFYFEAAFTPFVKSDLDLIRNLYQSILYDEAYLKQLCKQDGIEFSTFHFGEEYPSFFFSINLEKKPKKIR